MTQRFETVILGGGIVGWSAAYRLVSKGMQVAVIDANLDGRATSAGAGIVSPGTSIHGNPDIVPLTKAAVDWYPSLISQLAEDGETNTGFASPGTLFVFTDENEYARLPEVRAFAERQLANDVNCIGDISMLSGAEAKKLFPALAEIPGALHMSEGSRLDGRLMTGAMQRTALRRGAIAIAGEAVLEPDTVRDRTLAVGTEVISFDNLLIAAGAWTQDLFREIGLDVPVAPQRGQILNLSMRDMNTTDWPVIHGFHNHYLLGFPESRIVAGATREDHTGFDYRMTTGGVAQELNEALRVAPGLRDATISEIRVGFRPMSADGMPILGRTPVADHIYIATGHGSGGLTTGAVSGALVADRILDQKSHHLIERYSLNRFG